jgi:hypothetical protein
MLHRSSSTTSLFLILALTIFGLAVFPLPSSAQEIEKLSVENAKILADTPEDPPTEKLYGVKKKYEGRHYLAGDEWNLHLGRERIEGLGGAYLGIGSDQSYLLMTWQRPEIVFQIDYDPWVIDVHRLHHAFFVRAQGPRAFMKFWQKKSKAKVETIINEIESNEEKRKWLVKLWRTAQPTIHWRLVRLRALAKKKKFPSYLTHKEHYQSSWICSKRAEYGHFRQTSWTKKG